MSVTNLRVQMNGPTVRLSLRPHAHTDNGSDWFSSHSQSPALLHPHLGCTRAHSIIVRQKYVTEKLHMCMKKHTFFGQTHENARNYLDFIDFLNAKYTCNNFAL